MCVQRLSPPPYTYNYFKEYVWEEICHAPNLHVPINWEKMSWAGGGGGACTKIHNTLASREGLVDALLSILVTVVIIWQVEMLGINQWCLKNTRSWGTLVDNTAHFLEHEFSSKGAHFMRYLMCGQRDASKLCSTSLLHNKHDKQTHLQSRQPFIAHINNVQETLIFTLPPSSLLPQGALQQPWSLEAGMNWR